MPRLRGEAAKVVEHLEFAVVHVKGRRYATAGLHTMVALSHIVDLAPAVKHEITELSKAVFSEGGR